MTIEKPNSDQAGRDELQGGVTEAIRRFFLNEFEGMLPARVVSYDDATNRAVIKPLVMIGTTSGGKVSRASVANIPVYRFGGGGFFMRFPVKPGDLGWLKANDRDISLIFQRGGLEDWPNTERLHKFSDAMFFPDTFKDWVIDGTNADAAIWQSMDGTVCISLHAGKARVVAPLVEVEAPTVDVLSETVTVTTTQATLNATLTTINSNVELNGTLAIVGGALTHNGKDVGSTHYHVGSTSDKVPV